MPLSFPPDSPAHHTTDWNFWNLALAAMLTLLNSESVDFSRSLPPFFFLALFVIGGLRGLLHDSGLQKNPSALWAIAVNLSMFGLGHGSLGDIHPTHLATHARGKHFLSSFPKTATKPHQFVCTQSKNGQLHTALAAFSNAAHSRPSPPAYASLTSLVSTLCNDIQAGPQS